jgi:hypothetical protein
MSVYTVRFGAGATSSAGDHTIYTAPPGVVSVLRDIRLVSEEPGSTLATVYIFGLAAMYQANSSSAGEAFGFELRQVIEPGEELRLFTTGAVWDYAFTGYQLS